MKKILIFGFAFILLIGGISFKFITNQQNSSAAVITSTLKPVEVIKAARGEIRSDLQLSGTIEPNSHVMVFPKAAGKIIKMTVDEGYRVVKGETLAVVEHEELELQMRQAEAAYQAAQTAYNQARELAEIRVRSQVAQARAQLSAAQAALQQVKDLAEIRTISQIEGAEAGLASLQANLEKILRGAREEDRKQTQAAVNQAKANFVNTESNYKRMKKLFESGAVSRQAFESAQTQLDVAKAQYDVAVEQMRLIENGARNEDIEAMKAQVRGAEAALKLGRAQAETRTWEKDVALAESQVETAQAVLRAAEALETAKSWEAEMTAAETAAAQAKASLDLAKKRIADATITAPIAGVVSKRYLDLGGMASPSAPMFEIVDMKTVKATVDVIESDLSKLKRKEKVWIQVDALTEPVAGEISFISPTLEPASRTATVEITIDNAQMHLRPGMFARVAVPVEIHENVVLIPRSAVIEDREKDARIVFVIEDGMSKRRQVEFGLSQGNIVEIISGLSGGEQVVTAGQHSLKDGEAVTVVKRES